MLLVASVVDTDGDSPSRSTRCTIRSRMNTVGACGYAGTTVLNGRIASEYTSGGLVDGMD